MSTLPINRTWSKFSGENMTSDQYESFKQSALSGTTVRKTIYFSDFSLIDETRIMYLGTEFLMTPEAFKSLVRFLGLNNVMMNKLNNTIGSNSGQKLLGLMKSALSSNDDKNHICMIIDKQSTKIVDFVKSAQGVLSNGAFFGVFEDVMNNNKGMEIKNMAISNNDNVEISVINHNWEFNVSGLSDEYFKSGLVFINTPNATIINPFNERLICTNGMVVAEEGMSLILKNGDISHQNAFFDAARNLKGILSFEQEFKRRIIRMMDTTASYDELRQARHIMDYAVRDSERGDIKETLEYFLPEMEVKRAFLKQNVDLMLLERNVWKRVRTPHTVWDVVNKLTDLSSHPIKHGLSLKDGNSSMFQLQKEAGNISFKPLYDLEVGIKQIY